MEYTVWARGHTDPQHIPCDILYTRIAETIAWCDRLSEKHRINTSYSLLPQPKAAPRLRSGDLFPPLLHDGKDDIVCRIGFNRALLLNAFTWRRFSAFPDLLGGQLLVYFPDHDSHIYDGQSEVHSKGFFDVFNTPPCDTWIGYFFDPHSAKEEREHLLAYVPGPLVKLANNGINENVDDCIMWLADAPVAMRDRLGSGPIA